MNDIGHWEHPIDFVADEWVGFIYRIINNSNGMEYIGKKQFHNTLRRKVKGRKNRKVTIKESNWKSYTSSSVYLNDAIEEIGKENFTFMIESLHKSKSSLHYREVEVQIDEDVLRTKLNESGEKKYYNRAIGNIKFIPPDELSEETRHKMSLSVRERYNNMSEEQRRIISDAMSGTNNPMYGVRGQDHPRYGTTHSEATKKVLSDNMKGKFVGSKNPRYGKHPYENMTAEWVRNHKDNLSIKMSGDGNPMYGRNLYDEYDDTKADIIKKKISDSTKGIPKTEEHKKNMRKPKGKQGIVMCPYCSKRGGKSNMTRYHFDNCKEKV